MTGLQMKLEVRSKNVLAITKAKAKMYEFAVDETYQKISWTVHPRNLLIMTIGILGELAAIEARQDNVDNVYYDDLKSQLISVGQYFDALIQSRLADEITVYLKIIGAAAYYLAEMPGSSTVLSKGLDYDTDLLTETYLEGLLIWLLKSDYREDYYRVEDSYLCNDIDEVAKACSDFFEINIDGAQLIASAHNLRKTVYDSGTDRELLFADVITAVLSRKVSNSSINSLPEYTYIPQEQWLDVIKKPGFIKEFWPAQKMLGEYGVLSGVSAVVQMPTSSGKTKSSELIIRSSFLSGRATVAVIVAPFRALCREITVSLKNAFEGERVNVNELQDVMNVSDGDKILLEFLTSEQESHDFDSKSIIITTPEKLVYLMRHEPELAKNIGLLIFDEGHQFDTGRRGVIYELLVAYLKESVAENTQKVLISAVMANTNSIGEWLNGETGIGIQGNNLLPSIRSVAFASWTTRLGQLHYIDHEREAERDFFVPRVIEQINLGTRGRERKDRFFPEKDDNSSLAAYLGIKLCHQGPVAIFCGVKSTVTTISELLIDYYDRGLQLPPPKEMSDEDELAKIAHLSSLHFGDNFVFTKSIRLGILPHSANIPNGIRVSVEWAMESNKAVLVVCTSTLAQGVNLPIKYLIVTSTFQAGREISTRDFHNLIGRAGRAGHHTEGSIIFADTEIFDQRRNFRNKWKWQRALHLLDFTNTEDCTSSLKELVDPFDSDQLKTDVLEFILDPQDYRQRCVNTATEHSLSIESLLYDMDYKESLINTIESYFLSYLKEHQDASKDFFVNLVQGTLAYYLSDETEQETLKEAFKLIAERVLAIPNEKYHYFGKALLGVKQLLLIEDWVEKNGIEIELTDSSEELLELCWPILMALTKNKALLKIMPEEVLLDFAKNWIAGASYIQLLQFLQDRNAYYQAGTQRRLIKMDHVIDLTDSALSFDNMLFMGAIADIAEGKGLTEEAVKRLRILQTRIKLGLSNDLEIWLYTQGYVDREVCKLLSSSLGVAGVPMANFDYKILKKHFQIVEDCLSPLPSYFMEQ